MTRTSDARLDDAYGFTANVGSRPIDANLPEGASVGMDVIVTWRSASGAFLGRTAVDYNATRDYGCLVQLCSVGSDAKHGAWLNLSS